VSAAARWALANPELVSCLFTLALWLAANIARRNPPAVREGWRWWLWLAVERAMVLPWDRWFGTLHLPFRVEPDLARIDAAEARIAAMLREANAQAGTGAPDSGERYRSNQAPSPTEPADTIPVELDAATWDAADATPTTPRDPSVQLPQARPARSQDSGAGGRRA
jgi:hypothetical protein